MQQTNDQQSATKIADSQLHPNEQSHSSSANNNQQRKSINAQGNHQEKQMMDQETKLRSLNYELAEVYFPLTVLQIRYDVFPLRNRNFRNQYNVNGQHSNSNASSKPGETQNHFSSLAQMRDQEYDDDDLFAYQMASRLEYQERCKQFFILRDFFLLTKVQVTGTIVYLKKMDEKYFIGLDDTTGVILCVLWLNAYQHGSTSKMRQWMSQEKVELGETLSVLAQLENWQDKMQLNIQKMRLIRDSGEEMLQYQQALMAQQVYFDPHAAYERRLFVTSGQKLDLQRPDYAIREANKKMQQSVNLQYENNGGYGMNGEGAMEGEMLVQHTVKRVKKKLNDYILTNYTYLFKDVSKITKQEILEHQTLLNKAKEELKLSTQAEKEPVELLQECIQELEDRGFMNLLEQDAEEKLYQIKDQKEKLKVFVLEELQRSLKNSKESGVSHYQGMHFDQINKRVQQEFSNFYTKDFIFKIIDELFQQGMLREIRKFSYGLLDEM